MNERDVLSFHSKLKERICQRERQRQVEQKKQSLLRSDGRQRTGETRRLT